jgi:ABC-type Mn2+/Zn2+ transport system permease subunit
VLTGLHKELVLGAFDPAILEALGYPVRRLDAALYTLLALTIITCVPAVGAILPVALIVGPSVAALRLTRRIVPAMVAGAAFGALSGAVGLGLSLTWDLATGATVCLVTGGLFALGLLTGRRPRPRPVGHARSADLPPTSTPLSIAHLHNDL